MPQSSEPLLEEPITSWTDTLYSRIMFNMGYKVTDGGVKRYVQRAAATAHRLRLLKVGSDAVYVGARVHEAHVEPDSGAASGGLNGGVEVGLDCNGRQLEAVWLAGGGVDRCVAHQLRNMIF